MRALALVGALAGASLSGCAAEPEPLVVFAAASMTDVGADLADAYERASGTPVVLSTGATSTLARQVAAGAPADAALLAGEAWPEWLGEASARAPQDTEVAGGALAVVIPREAPGWPGLGTIAEAERVAVADPRSVPAGAYARELLVAAGLWDAVEPRLIPMPHVRAALVAVETGQADAAIVYRSDLAVSDRVREAVSIPDPLQPRATFHCLVTAPPETTRHEAARAWCALAHRRADLWIRRGFRPLP